MLASKTLYFLFLLAFVSSIPLTETQAQNFIQVSGLVPPTATFQSFTISPNEQNVIVTYKDDNANFKFVLGKDEQGTINLIFKQELLSIGFGGMGNAIGIEIIPEIKFQAMNLPLPVQISTPFEAVFSQPLIESRNQMGYSRQRFQNNRNKPCKLNEEQIKIQIKENLQIFKNAEIKEIRKVGFEFGTGLLLEIDLQYGNKKYTIHAVYIPRKNKLNVVQIVENKAQENKLNPFETGKELFGKVMNDVKTPLKSVQNVGLKFENIIQSFVEKLLRTKNLKLGENQEYELGQPLIGSEEEPERPTPLILGSEREIERIQEPLSSASSSSSSSSSSSAQTSTSFSTSISEQEDEKIVSQEIEEESEEISELVGQVLSKLKMHAK